MTQTNYHKDTKSASWLYKQHAEAAAYICLTNNMKLGIFYDNHNLIVV